MKKILLLLFTITTVLVSAQSTNRSTSSYLNQFRVHKNEVPNLKLEDFFSTQGTLMGLSSDDELRLLRSEAGMNGFQHHRYEHYYKGVQVYGSQYLVHTKDGLVTSSNGSYFPGIELSVEPALTEEQALRLAMNKMDAEEYAWELQTKSRKERPEPQLVIIDRAIPKVTGNYKLAYRVELASTKPFAAMSYFVDAQSGHIIFEITEDQTHAVPGSGKTKYYGEQSFTVDSISSDVYILRDPSRSSSANAVYNGTPGNIFTNTSSFFDLENEDQNEVAVDAHYLIAEFYDVLRDEFDWLGLDNNDRAMEAIIHAGDFINASWNGSHASFGNGDCNHGPLVTAEVVSHEFMHGIIDFTSELIYRDESGAINESMADVMGQYLEYVIDRENFSWELGSSFHLTEGLNPLRHMDDPLKAMDPELYGGELWVDGGGVHTNSSIGNLMYVMLSDGREGTNAAGVDFQVQGIGIEQAAKFLFYVNRMYLNPSSTYNEYSAVSLLAAEEFFGGDPVIMESIANAWKAVGLPTIINTDDVYDLIINTFTETVSCEWGEFANIILSIDNVGTIPYEAASGGRLIITDGSDDSFEEYLLLEDILPGESFELIVDDQVVRNREQKVVFYELFVADEENGNLQTDFILTTEVQENEIAVATQVLSTSCFQTEFPVGISISNLACNTLLEGTNLILRIENNSGETVLEEILETEVPLEEGGTITYERLVEIQEGESFSAIVTLVGDNNPLNNESTFSVATLEPIKNEYFNGFDSSGDLDNQISVGVLGFRDNIFRYERDDRFTTTGFFGESSGPLCHIPEDNWNLSADYNFSGDVSAVIDACLDLEKMEGPKVLFDLLQWRNENDDFAGTETSSLRLTWEEQGQLVEQVIEGQEEGVNVAHTIDLPARYKGPFSMQFLTRTGTELTAGDFLFHDVMMLNNLIILNDGASSTKDQSESIRLSLFPNPAAEELFLETSEILKAYSIFDLNGRLLHREANLNEKLVAVDISQFDAGMYNLLAEDKKGNQVNRKFVKVD